MQGVQDPFHQQHLPRSVRFGDSCSLNLCLGLWGLSLRFEGLSVGFRVLGFRFRVFGVKVRIVGFWA